jgi:DNA-binding SARP family transcriptional activator
MVTTAAHRSDIEFCLLGPLRVIVDGSDVPVGGPRQMAVLARLVVTPGQVVSMEQLIDSVWDGGEPKQPHVAIRSYVSNLRRAIEPNRRRRAADSCLASAPPGYRLAIDPEAVDWVRFQRLVDEARAALAVDDFETALARLRRAMSLWRGEPCAGLPSSEVFEAHRVRMTALRQTAVELLFDCLLRQGHHDLVASEVEAAIVADPLRERLTELGMLALYRSGRQSEALALGRRLRDRLLEELGIDPSPSIGEMELRILNHDPSLDAEPVPETAPAVADAGVDQGRRPAPVGAGLAAGPPGPAPAPAERPLVVGRGDAQEQLWAMAEALAEGRMAAAAIVGEQGIGKTVLVHDLVARLEQRGVPAVWAHSVADSSGPLWPWAQVVLGVLQLAGDDEGDRIALTAGLEALAGLGPSVAAALPKRVGAHAAPTAEIMLAVTRFLERVAQRGALVVVLEDLHWADRPSITMLDYAVTTLGGSPVGFVATWRGNQIGDGTVATGLRSLSRLAGMVRLDIGPLDHPAVVELARSLDNPLSPEEAEAVGRRAAGNPAFVRELVLQPGDRSGSALSPALKDAVIDRIERLHSLAMPVLRAAALFRAPFTVEDLEPLRPPTVTSIDRVITAAVRGGVLEETDPRIGTHRFRHEIVREVLEGATISTELRTSHRIIGVHLLKSDEAEASYHLSWSPEPADRALAARLVLDLFHRGSRTVPLPELDARVRSGLTAAESLRRSGDGPTWDQLVTDALGFLSWRARVDDRPVDWYDNAWRNLRAAVEGLEAPPDPDPAIWSARTSATPLRGIGADQPRDRSIDRLERSVLNLIGLATRPAGPGDPADFAALSGPLLEELAAAIELLPPDSPAREAGRIHLLAVRAPRGGATQARPQATREAARVRAGREAARGKAVREATRVLSSARRRLEGPGAIPLVAAHLARFADDLDPAEIESTLEAVASSPGPRPHLLWARYGYPALLARGEVDRAGRVVETALSSAEADGDPLQRAEARLLWNRHLLWIGELDAAERSIAEVSAELETLGLPEPLPVLRQQRVLRTMRGEPGDPLPPSRDGETAPGLATLVGFDRASPAEQAFRLANIGQRERAAERVERLADPEIVDQGELAELALLGAAAWLSGNRRAARLAQRRLVEVGDRLIVRGDGSAILGPASLWAAIAARGAGRRREASQLLDSAIELAAKQGSGAQLASLLGVEVPT